MHESEVVSGREGRKVVHALMLIASRGYEDERGLCPLEYMWGSQVWERTELVCVCVSAVCCEGEGRL